MDVLELFSLTGWVSEEVVGKSIPQKYQDLFNVLQKNLQPNESKVEFESQLTALVTALRSVNVQKLTEHQAAALDKLGIRSHVGEEGAALVHEIFVRSPLDLATCTKRIEQALSLVNGGVKKSNALRQGLTPIVEQGHFTQEDVLVRVSFAGRASIGNVVDLKKWSEVWHDIARGVVMLHGKAPEDVKVVRAGAGSLIVDLGVVYAIATTLSSVLLLAAHVADKVLDILKKAEEIKSLKLTNTKIAQELEAAARTERDAGVEAISSEIVKLMGDGAIEGDVIVAFRNSVKNLILFIEKGGSVDFVMPEASKDVVEDDATKAKREELRLQFQKVRQIESKIRLLGHSESATDGG